MVSQQFDKYLYLSTCLNTHNHNTCTHLLQNRLYCKKDGILYSICQDLLTQKNGLPAPKCHQIRFRARDLHGLLM